MEAQERDLMKSALLAVAADASAVPTCKQVEEAVRSKFGLGDSGLQVTLAAKATFLLRFGSQRKRCEALQAEGPLAVGRANLRFIPWSRCSGATAGKLLYRARVCLEGVPRHAWQIDEVK